MIVAAVLWEGTPFYTMNFLAGLAVIPAELYEAAKIDGANTIQCFWSLHTLVDHVLTASNVRTGQPSACPFSGAVVWGSPKHTRD
jgi:ABC-type sulfate transport system permease component